jgi:hypothetical protein
MSWVYEERGPGDDVVPTSNLKSSHQETKRPVQEEISSDGKPLQVVRYSHSILPKNTDLRRYSNVLSMTIALRNNTTKTITAWKANIVIKDPFGSTIVMSPWTEATADIKPGASQQLGLSYEDNQFIDDDGYSRLSRFNSDKVSLQLNGLEVVYAAMGSGASQPTQEYSSALKTIIERFPSDLEAQKLKKCVSLASAMFTRMDNVDITKGDIRQMVDDALIRQGCLLD